MKKYINLGCGAKYSTEKIWLNADMVANSNDVIECNFLKGIPFKNNEFDAVYHSHVIEHFSKSDAVHFISECYRILNKNGIIRIACPNLEVIAKEYLKNLERAINNEENAEEDYDWIMLEMYDQTVRNESGGDMFNYFKKKNVSNIDYVANRVGDVAREWFTTLNEEQINDESPKKSRKTIKQVLKNGFRNNDSLNQKYQDIGKFRLGGEIHQWMYDRFSLKRLLEKIGFQNVLVRTATQSYIDNWESYKLDNPNESASIFIEGLKLEK